MCVVFSIFKKKLSSWIRLGGQTVVDLKQQKYGFLHIREVQEQAVQDWQHLHNTGEPSFFCIAALNFVISGGC